MNSLPAGVRNDMMIGGQTRSPLSEAGIALGSVAALKGGLGAIGTTAAARGLGYKGAQVGFTGCLLYTSPSPRDS